MELQLILIGVAGLVSTLIISSIKKLLSKKGEDHELTDNQMSAIVFGVSLVATAVIEVVRNDFTWTCLLTNYAAVLGSSLVLYRLVLKEIKVHGKSIKDYLENN